MQEEHFYSTKNGGKGTELGLQREQDDNALAVFNFKPLILTKFIFLLILRLLPRHISIFLYSQEILLENKIASLKALKFQQITTHQFYLDRNSNYQLTGFLFNSVSFNLLSISFR